MSKGIEVSMFLVSLGHPVVYRMLITAIWEPRDFTIDCTKWCSYVVIPPPKVFS